MKQRDHLRVKFPWIEAEGTGWGILGLVILVGGLVVVWGILGGT
jgi:hypothetical protein